MTIPSRVFGVALAVLVVGASFEPSALADGIKTYISLGDSRAFGYTDPAHLVPSFGDQGYVQPYADYLASRNGGVRPQVVNLAVPGETTSSFFTGGNVATLPSGGSGAGGSTDTSNPQDRFLGRLPSVNLNYTDPAASQNSMLMQTIAGEKAAGHAVSNVTISLGANDLFATALSPGFLTSSPQDQQSRLVEALGTIQQNYTHLLTELRTQLPNANIALIGSYNPFPAAPSSPFAPLAGPATAALNQVLKEEATAFGAQYVDTFSPFVGHEAELTYIGMTDLTGFPNVHPNAKGYAVIAAQIEAVPEPATLALWSAGLLGLAAAGLRRRRCLAARD